MTARQRQTKGSGATGDAGAAVETVRVVLPNDSPFVAVGRYARGNVVEVSPTEARRLIEVKSFARADHVGSGAEI
jgi:hypothetical protein